MRIKLVIEFESLKLRVLKFGYTSLKRLKLGAESFKGVQTL